MSLRRAIWLIGSVATLTLGLLGAYAVLAVATQPLTAGITEDADAGYMEPAAFPGDRGSRWLDYNDGQTITVTKWLSNTGNVGLTVTGVETSPSASIDLMSITTARAGVIQGPAKCCVIDQAATWSTRDFKPFTIAPGQQGAVVFHVLLSHCENSGPGAMVGIDTVKIRYRILGFPHIQDVPLLDRLLIRSPMVCPRTGPARPAE